MQLSHPMSPASCMRLRSASRSAGQTGICRTPSTSTKDRKPYSKNTSHNRSASSAKINTNKDDDEEDQPIELIITEAITRKAFGLFCQDIEYKIRDENPKARKYEVLLVMNAEWQKIRETDVERAYELRAIEAMKIARVRRAERRQGRLGQANTTGACNIPRLPEVYSEEFLQIPDERVYALALDSPDPFWKQHFDWIRSLDEEALRLIQELSPMLNPFPSLS